MVACDTTVVYYRVYDSMLLIVDLYHSDLRSRRASLHRIYIIQ